MLLLYVLTSAGHLQGGNLQINTFIINAVKDDAHMKLKYSIINQNIAKIICRLFAGIFHILIIMNLYVNISFRSSFINLIH